jgi:hypothetical protein
MEQEKKSKIEIWLRDLFKDIGNLAVAVSSFGKFQATKEEPAEETSPDDEEGEKPRRVLHPSMFRQQPGEFFTPVHHKKD